MLKVVDEKLANNKQSRVQVKCNTILSDILLNSKRIEIENLEKKHSSRISFNLDSHYSLHEPEISLIDKNSFFHDVKKDHKNLTPKKRISKKNTNLVKEKKKLTKKKGKLEKHNYKINIKSKELSEKEKQNQKTGWWSE